MRADTSAPTLPAQLSRRLATEQADRRLPSVSAAWARGGELIWQDAVGTVDGQPGGPPATPATQYRIGSITKTFVAVLTLRLCDAGELRLDDPLSRIFPGTPLDRSTIGQLLSQSAGTRAETENPWWERTPGVTVPELLGQLELRPPAVGRFHYSNVGFGVLGAVVEKLRGVPWTDCLRSDILEPLGMTRTSTRPVAPHAVGLAVHPYADLVLVEPEHDAVAMAPAGQLWSTTADLIRFATFLDRGDGRILDGSTLAAMKRPHSWDDQPGQAWTRGYGYGLDIVNLDGQRIYGHGGSMPGFLAGLRFRDDGDAIVTFANATYGLSAALSTDLFALVDRLAPPVPTGWHTQPDADGWVELTGAWFWGPARFTLSVRAGGWLELTPVENGRGSRFRPVGPDHWEGQDGYYLGEPLRVVRPVDAPPYLDLASFRFTRTPYDPAADVPGDVDPAGWH